MRGRKFAPSHSAQTPRYTHPILRWVGAIALVVIAGGGLRAGAASDPRAANGEPALETVTVEARRQLERQVNHYVSSVLVHYLDDSLVRWNMPICPLVAGLPRERGEFILSRISQIATAARAPLAGEHCQANFYVIVTPEPERLLKQWRHRNPRLFNTTNGMGSLKRFLNSPDPVRCWYNTDFQASDGGVTFPEMVGAGLYDQGLKDVQVPTISSPEVTRLAYTAVQGLTSVIIVVDMNRTRDLNMGQLADYVGMLGLSQIRIDADIGAAPSILHLFREAENPPTGLSSWDQAFLYSLYNTNQANMLQMSLIKTSMLRHIAPK